MIFREISNLISNSIRQRLQNHRFISSSSSSSSSFTFTTRGGRRSASADQFTFNTKYPKKIKKSSNSSSSSSSSYGAGAKTKSFKSKSVKTTQLAIPSRFRLSKIPQSSSTTTTTTTTTTTDNNRNKGNLGKVSASKGSSGAKPTPSSSTLPLKKSPSTNEKFALVEKIQLDSWFEDASVAKSPRTWPQLHLIPPLMDAIKGALKFSHPAPVQAIFLDHVLRSCTDASSSILCGSQTGSGKTAAYLIALFQELKGQEMAKGPPADILDADLDAVIDKEASTLLRKVKRPRAIVLVPSRHLVHQIGQVAKGMAHHCRLRVVSLHSKTRHARDLYEESPIDILVTTPTTLLHLIQEEGFSLSQLCRIVLDEADTLFDKNFLEETSSIIDKVQKMSQIQGAHIPFFLFTATFPQTLNQTVSSLFSGLVKLTTPSLHRPVKSVHHAFLRLNQSTTKNNLLVETLKRSSGDTSHHLVFCNKQSTATDVASFLQTTKNMPNVHLLSSHLPHAQLTASEHAFTTTGGVAVATDMASRGWDTVQVGHVVNYDFPVTVMDYVHRAGRTGRFGRRGRVTSLVERRDCGVAELIEERIKRGASL